MRSVPFLFVIIWAHGSSLGSASVSFWIGLFYDRSPRTFLSLISAGPPSSNHHHHHVCLSTTFSLFSFYSERILTEIFWYRVYTQLSGIISAVGLICRLVSEVEKVCAVFTPVEPQVLLIFTVFLCRIQLIFFILIYFCKITLKENEHEDEIADIFLSWTWFSVHFCGMVFSLSCWPFVWVEIGLEGAE